MAFEKSENRQLWPAAIDSWDEVIEWGIIEYGSKEALGEAVERAQRDDLMNKIALLRPAAAAGHLPSMRFLISYFRGSTERGDLPGLPTDVERDAWSTLLYERGFPLASKPTPVGAYDRGFHGNYRSPPSEEFLRKLKPAALPGIREELARNPYTSQEEALELRTAHIESLRWSAARGDTSSWERLESAYDQVVADWGGDIEYQIERYAWLELTKRLWTLGGDSNVPRKHQDELAVEIARGGGLERAKELADRYVHELWPRRIAVTETAGKCRLLPQFREDEDPYRDAESVVRRLDPPIPPALRPRPEPRRRIEIVRPESMENAPRCAPYSGCY